jgi:hypothetical protein
MKLAAGPLKFLLLDPEAVERNIARTEGRTQPISRVIVQNEDGTTTAHFATNVTVVGEVRLGYSQHAPLLKLHNESIRAAYVTNSEIVLDEPVVEEAPPPTKPAKPAKPARVTTVVTEEPKPNGE